MRHEVKETYKRHVAVLQVYRVFRGRCITKEKTADQYRPPQLSNTFYTTVATISNVYGRKGSLGSVLSEGLPSCQYEKCSAPDKAKRVRFHTLPVEHDKETLECNTDLISHVNRSTEDELANLDEKCLLNTSNFKTVLYMEEPKLLAITYKSTKL